MGTFSRIRYVIAANVNAMLERAENPEKLLRALIREMEEAQEEARLGTSELLAEQTGLERRLKRIDADISRWKHRSELAVKQDRDDLARAALITRGELESQRDALQQQHAEASSRVKQVRQDMNSLNQKLAQAKQVLAEISKRPSKSNTDGIKLPPMSRGDRRLQRALGRFDHLESQVESLEARVRSYDYMPESGTSWQSLEGTDNTAIEAELEALKTRVGAAVDAEPALEGN